MMTLDLHELERLEREATSQAPPPWIASSARQDGTACVYLPSDGPCRRIVPVAETSAEQAALIAAARNALPALLARVRELEAEVRRERADYAEARADLARMVGHLSACSNALGVEQWAEMPKACAELRAMRALAEAAKDHVDNHGRDDTYGAVVAAVKAWRGSR